MRRAYLPPQRYINFMDQSVWRASSDPLLLNRPPAIAVHMTCVEGVRAKQYVAKQYYGWVDVKGYYSRPQKTLSFRDISRVNLSLLLSAARTLGRAVRQPDGRMVLSPDTLATLQVEMVETLFWDRAMRASPQHPLRLLSLSESQLRELLTHPSRSTGVDEIRLLPSTAAESPEAHVDAMLEQVACRHWLQQDYHWHNRTGDHRPGCLRWCDGVRFRGQSTARSHV